MSVGSVIDQWQRLPFTYGKTDCCQFVGALVNAHHGHNPMEKFPFYGDVRQALQAIRRYGSLENAVTATIGVPRSSVRDSQDGDVLLIRLKTGEESLAYNDRGLALVRLDNGRIAHLSVEDCLKAWEV